MSSEDVSSDFDLKYRYTPTIKDQYLYISTDGRTTDKRQLEKFTRAFSDCDLKTYDFTVRCFCLI